MHLQLARLLLRRLPPTGIDAAIFDLVHQFNCGIALISDAAEKEQMCRLNALAGKKEKASAAYASARNYLVQAVALLAQDDWNRRYDEVFVLHLDCAECEAVIGNFQQADTLFDAAMAQVRTNTDRALSLIHI